MRMASHVKVGRSMKLEPPHTCCGKMFRRRGLSGLLLPAAGKLSQPYPPQPRCEILRLNARRLGATPLPLACELEVQ